MYHVFIKKLLKYLKNCTVQCRRYQPSKGHTSINTYKTGSKYTNQLFNIKVSKSNDDNNIERTKRLDIFHKLELSYSFIQSVISIQYEKHRLQVNQVFETVSTEEEPTNKSKGEEEPKC